MSRGHLAASLIQHTECTDEFFERMQLSHYILGVLSLQMSRDIHYGDKSCYAKNTSNLDLVAKCTGISGGEK